MNLCMLYIHPVFCDLFAPDAYLCLSYLKGAYQISTPQIYCFCENTNGLVFTFGIIVFTVYFSGPQITHIDMT